MTLVEVDVRNVAGEVQRKAVLDEHTFGIDPHPFVLHQVITAQLAAARAGTQSTKTRAEVSGGGAKPFKQKGTGRARQGSERAPHYTHGGIALGPKPRSYRQRTPKKMISLALRSALSDRASLGRVAVVEGWPWEIPDTKSAVKALAALGIEGKVLVVLGEADGVAYKSFRNLPDVQLIMARELNAYDVLRNEWTVFSTGTLPGRTEAESGTAPAAEAATRSEVTEAKADVKAEPEATVAPEVAVAAEPVAADPAVAAAVTAEPEELELEPAPEELELEPGEEELELEPGDDEDEDDSDEDEDEDSDG